jgi:hypothetical protein
MPTKCTPFSEPRAACADIHHSAPDNGGLPPLICAADIECVPCWERTGARVVAEFCEDLLSAAMPLLILPCLNPGSNVFDDLPFRLLICRCCAAYLHSSQLSHSSPRLSSIAKSMRCFLSGLLLYSIRTDNLVAPVRHRWNH